MLKTKNKKQLVKNTLSVLAVLIAAVNLGSHLSAQTLNRGYKSDETLQQGMLVKEKDDDPGKVEPVTVETVNDLKGVVVAKNESPVVIASDDQSVFVASTGVNDVLVSDENGPINQGDYVTVSSIAGIGMKTGSGQSVVLGRAAEKFSGHGDSIGATTLKAGGKKVNLGRIAVDIAITNNPLRKDSRLDTVPRILRDVSSSVAGRPVSNARIWLAVIIFMATSLVTGIMLYGGAKSSLLALGRNPLSKASILRGLMQVVILGLIVFICGMFGVYLLLKL